jgi:gliding motility-associated-like protein
MYEQMKQFIILLFFINNSFAQSDVPLTLRAQFNGSYGYTIIGNTHNEFDNYQNPSPPCQMITQSAATLNLLPTQNIVAAYLYWSGVGDGTFDTTIELNGIEYSSTQTSVTFPENNFIFSYFGSYCDITSQVINSGNGVYTFSSLNLNPIIFTYCSNGIYFSGWTILVVFNEIGLPNQQINVYDGLNVVNNQFNNGQTSLNINNLNVVSTNNANMTYVAYNGSPNLFFNEFVTVNGNILNNSLNPPNNPFNGTNSFTGSTTSWNQDIDTYDISSFINTGDTQANIAFNSVFIRNIQTLVTSIRSELPDATVDIDIVGGQEVCNNRDLTVAYTVSNSNSNAVLPANVPVSVYANDVFLQTVFTNASIPINGSLSITQFVSIPLSIPNTFTLKVIVDNTATSQSTIAESNENNNEAIQVITLSDNIQSPTFNIPNTFCQGANVPTLPLLSSNNISGTWSPDVISNQNSGSYVFTPNAGQCGLPFTLNVAISQSINPTFSIPNSFCEGENVPTLPLVSSNNISGTWLPNVISNQNSGNYVFTPNAGQCGLPFTMDVTILNTILPTFNIPNSFCQGANVPTLPYISDNNILGTWSPNVISNQNSGSYVFTPDTGTCGLPFTLNVTISPSVNPTFSIPNSFCQGATVPTLPLLSSNNISGTWLPDVISNQNSGSYVFTPNPNQCSLPFTLNVTISPSINPTFSIPTTFCQGATVPALPLVSSNNISGTWSPSVISNQNSGSYVFTPNAGQCGLPFTLDVTISPSVNPTFSIPTTFCQGETVPVLPSNSDIGISGTWSPDVISNQNSVSYVFTPNAGQCSLPFTLNVTISPSVNPTFSLPTTFCQGANVPTLPLVSSNNILGTWLPNVISNQNSATYVFTPNAGTCWLPFTLNVTISPSVNPTFSIPNTFCQGETVPVLPSNSDIGISGTWFPNIISNQNSGSYVFTPDASQCGMPFTLNVTIDSSNTIDETVFICEDENGNTVFPVNLNTGLSGGSYAFSWFESGTPIVNTLSSLSVFSAGTYQAVASSIASDCDILFDFEVLPLQPLSVEIIVPKADFEANPTIVVIASGGSGQYLYSFDNLPFQSNPFFNVRDGGSIAVVVKDVNGCYTFSDSAEVWNYLRFFTPNNDGFNDTWGIVTQKPISVEIFDRYGKLIRKLQNTERWDGLYNNQLMPSTDYWFVIYYDEFKVYRSHFSLKR